MMFQRTVHESEPVPRGYGVAYVRPMSGEEVCYPVPVHVVVAWARGVWWRTRVGPWRRMQERARRRFAILTRQGSRESAEHAARAVALRYSMDRDIDLERIRSLYYERGWRARGEVEIRRRGGLGG
jgi:hypothetical protein